MRNVTENTPPDKTRIGVQLEIIRGSGRVCSKENDLMLKWRTGLRSIRVVRHYMRATDGHMTILNQTYPFPTNSIPPYSFIYLYFLFKVEKRAKMRYTRYMLITNIDMEVEAAASAAC